MSAPGFPAGGYSMNLAGCVWRFGKITDGPRVQEASTMQQKPASRGPHGTFMAAPCLAEPYTDVVVRHFPLLPCASGTAKGIAFFSGDLVATLLKSPALQRYRLGQIAAAVKGCWSAGPRVRDPYRGRDAARVEAVAHQLCEWEKGGREPVVNFPATIVRGGK